MARVVWNLDLVGALPILLALLPWPNLLPAGTAWASASLVANALLATLPPACPDDMVLVDGDFCPALSYVCLRSMRPSNRYGCAEYGRTTECQGALDLRRYCIDRHEWPNRIGENPRVYVNFREAQTACGSVGKRLCRRSEWIFACEGPKWLPYPWGYVRQPSPCNIDRAPVEFDIQAMLDPASRDEEITRLWQADPIGSHPGCVSTWGAYDMSGNVDEWTDNQADDPETKHIATLNGGYWGPVRDTCRLTTASHGPTFAFYQAGFRCCEDAQDGVDVPPPHRVRLRSDSEREKE